MCSGKLRVRIFFPPLWKSFPKSCEFCVGPELEWEGKWGSHRNHKWKTLMKRGRICPKHVQTSLLSVFPQQYSMTAVDEERMLWEISHGRAIYIMQGDMQMLLRFTGGTCTASEFGTARALGQGPVGYWEDQVLCRGLYEKERLGRVNLLLHFPIHWHVLWSA